MKTRNSFVANSSSSSFIIGLDKNCVKFIEAIVTISGCSRTEILHDNKQDIISELRGQMLYEGAIDTEHGLAAKPDDDEIAAYDNVISKINEKEFEAMLMVDVALEDDRTRDAFGALMFNKGITIITSEYDGEWK